MNTGKKGNIINNLPLLFSVESTINPARLHAFKTGLSGEGSVIYFIERELRVKDNFALVYSDNLAKKLNKNLKIVHLYNQFDSKVKKDFYEKELEILKNDMQTYDFDFQVIDYESVVSFINGISPAEIIIDFNPIRDESVFKSVKYKITEIDGHNIIPARYISDKQEYSAFQFRKKVYNNIYGFFTEFKEDYESNSNAYQVLNDFIINRLDSYADEKNNPSTDFLSHLSPYLNFGFISSQRVALEVYKSNAGSKNKEAFLEELIVRKELADNFCLYNKNFRNLRGAPVWAARSLLKHKNDFRAQVFSLKELENSKTKDIIWNDIQTKLVKTGEIHGYLRMYWAKMLLMWTESPMDAIDAAIYLNDKYALDSPSSNGYTGILWSIAGLHDRPFQEHSIYGKIRTMSYAKLYKKLYGKTKNESDNV